MRSRRNAIVLVAGALACSAGVQGLAPVAQCAPAHRHSGTIPPWVTHSGFPILPPPLIPYVPTFLSLYHSYQAMPEPKSFSFSEWVRRHGVTDPVTYRAMMELYLLFERASQA